MQIRTNAATGTVKTTTRGLQNMMDRQLQLVWHSSGADANSTPVAGNP